MSKIRDLMVEIPFRCGIGDRKAAQIAAMMGMYFDYESKEIGKEFERLGDSFDDCEKRLGVLFDMLDMSARDEAKLNDAKQLLMLASTPDAVVQDEIMLTYGENGGSFDDLLTVREATEIGARGWWNG